MTTSRLVLTAALAILPAGGAAATASADRLETPLTGAAGLTSGGGWDAWSVPDDGGEGWKLTVRSPSGTVSTPDIATFAKAPGVTIGSGVGFDRALLAVYSRCDGASATAGCDVYAYDLKTGREAKVRKLSNPRISETAASVSGGQWTFVRRDGSRPGVYRYKPSTRETNVPTRIAATVATETVTNGTRVLYAYRTADGGALALRRLSGRGKPLSLAVEQPTVPVALKLTRYRAGWLLPGADGTKIFSTTRFGGSGGPYAASIEEGSRTLPAGVRSGSGDSATLFDRYLAEDGIHTLDPSPF